MYNFFVKARVGATIFQAAQNQNGGADADPFQTTVGGQWPEGKVRLSPVLRTLWHSACCALSQDFYIELLS